jgi:hypothetical protein
MLAAFAGLAAAQQITGITVTQNTYPTLRSEGLTEPLPTLVYTATLGAVTLNGGTATYDITLLSNSGAPFTSAPGTIVVSGNATAAPAVTGAVVRIPAVVFTFAAGSNMAQVTITGLRIDANANGPNTFVTLQSTEFPSSTYPATGGIGVAGIVPPFTQTQLNVAQVLTSLAPSVSATAAAPVTFSNTNGSWTSAGFDPTETVLANLPGTGLFNVQFKPLYAGAFFTSGIENPLRFTFSLTNLPAGLALYVPQATAKLQLILGTDANGLGGYPAPPSLAAYPVPANGMVTYQALASDGSQPPAYVVQVYSVGTTPLALTSAAAPVTFMGSYAPLSSDVSASASSPVLRFAKTSVIEADSFIIVTLPSSHFVFPYVVSGSGWVTGIAIVNAGSGFGSATAPTKGTAGTCKLTFYSADGVTAAPAAVTVPLASASMTAIPAGGNYGFTLDQAITGGYAGIVYGVCNFDNVQAFGYLNGDGTTAAYLAIKH